MGQLYACRNCGVVLSDESSFARVGFVDAEAFRGDLPLGRERVRTFTAGNCPGCGGQHVELKRVGEY